MIVDSVGVGRVHCNGEASPTPALFLFWGLGKGVRNRLYLTGLTAFPASGPHTWGRGQETIDMMVPGPFSNAMIRTGGMPTRP